ncbi:MAG TPA: hypothetical protein EYP55_04990 [Anaerolineae bacterium]|nr:hypothetical protein [Anaerolineae bacterium]
MFKLWYGESDEDAKFLAEISDLKDLSYTIQEIYPSNTRDFVRNPDLIRDLLYLDKPDVIITMGEPEKPIFGVEFCAEAGTGHDYFQRVARIVAAAEFGTPFAYVFPEKKWVQRRGTEGRWDLYNPLMFRTLVQIGCFHQTPVLGFFWDSDQEKGQPQEGYLCFDSAFPKMPDRASDEIQALARFLNLTLAYARENRPFASMVFDPFYGTREAWMWEKYHDRAQGRENWSPLSACSVVKTVDLEKQAQRIAGMNDLKLPPELAARPESVVYSNNSRTFRGDPYAGALCAVDYLWCRNGPTVRHRYRNLVIRFAKAPYAQVVEMYRRYYRTRCPFQEEQVETLRKKEGLRYLTLHLKDGCRYTKKKELRIICSVADIVLFKDGVLF